MGNADSPGSTTKLRRKLGRAGAVAALALAPILTAGCSGSDDDGLLQIDDLRLTRLPSGAKIISGSVHNSSTDDVSGVLVQISLFDDDNNLLSSMTIGVEGVEAGGNTRFREPVDSDLDVSRARVKKIVPL